MFDIFGSRLKKFMINPRELAKRLQELKEAYLSERDQIILNVANAASALMKRRVINERIDSSGNSFGTYKESTLKKKGTRVSSDTRINFSDTNRMWSGNDFPDGRGVQAALLKPVSDTDTQIDVIIQPENDPNRQFVLEILEGKFGAIVEWSNDEIEFLKNLWIDYFTDLKARYGF